MDSDDQSSSRQFGSDENALVEFKVNILDKLNGNEDQNFLPNQHNQSVDRNGNRIDDEKSQTLNNNDNHEKTNECNCIEISSNLITRNTTTDVSDDNYRDDKIMRKLQSMSISDDDYGKIMF